MNNDVCVYSTVNFLKQTTRLDSLIRLELTENGITDETVIRFTNQATTGFDGDYDASKFFSYAETRPSIFSTASNNMSINALPSTTETIGIDVKGTHASSMTISTTELLDIANIYLRDELTGIETNIAIEDYSFTYDNSFQNRFTLHFTITDLEEHLNADIPFITYAHDNLIMVKIEKKGNYDVSIHNLLGQELYSKHNAQTELEISNLGSGYYLVVVSDGSNRSVKKVILK